MAMLEVNDIKVYYGMIQAIKGVSFHVDEGEVIALIGANGAGKTTILHTVSGLLTPKEGTITFEGQDLVKIPGHKIVSMGMAHVPEGRRVFAQLSVLQNLMMGAYTRKDKEEIAQTLETVFDRFPRLKERQNQMAGTLSGGEQQMLAMGRALMSHPKIILMDEPSMGLSPIFVNEIFDIIQEVSKSGTTVLLVEQNAKKALSIADRAYVLETGKIVLEGKASDLLNNDSIKKMLAKKLNVHYYDKELMKLASDDSGINEALFVNADEKVKSTKLFHIAKKEYHGELIPPESDDFTSTDNLFNYQAKIIRDLAKEESCVIIGRCADYVLKDYPNVLSVFIHAPKEYCLEGAAKKHSMSPKELERFINKTDKHRAEYYKYHTGREWTDARNYDLCLDSSKLGYERCVDEIISYMKVRFPEE